MQERIGKIYTVLIEGMSFDKKYYIGRTYMDVPDMDGVIFIENKTKERNKIGKFVDCKIISMREYDLLGEET